jgi:hypothetical protein
LRHEPGIRGRRRARHVNPAAPEIEHEERVVGDQPARGPDLAGEEVRSRDRAPVSSQKRPPGRQPVRSGRDPVGLEAPWPPYSGPRRCCAPASLAH